MSTRRKQTRSRTERAPLAGTAGVAAGAKRREPLGDRIFNHAAALLFLVLLPAGLTFVAPVAWTSFARHDGVVVATATTNLLFVIPFSRETVTGVREVAFDFEGGGTTRSLNRYVKYEDKGWLVISGDSGRAVVPVAAVVGGDVAARVTDFLGRPDVPSLTIFTYAHRVFSLLVGGLVSLLTLCYVGLWGLQIKVALNARRRRAEGTAALQ
jgi:hypothetical protein